MARFLNCKWDDVVGCHYGHANTASKGGVTTTSSRPPVKSYVSPGGGAQIENRGEGTSGGPTPCEVPACKTKTSAFARVMAGGSKNTSKTASRPSSSAVAKTVSRYTAAEFAASGQCPADREELGSHSWVLLHSVAAYYPDKPSADDARRAAAFVDSLSYLYPCTHCAAAFRDDLSKNPPVLSSSKEFSEWMCRMHNSVNRQLGKAAFPCDIATLDARWRTGHPNCWGEDAEGIASDTLGQEGSS